MDYDYISGVGKPVSRIVQGTAMINSNETEKYFRLLDEVFELGCNTFDTGHQYRAGDCERTLGRWIEARGLRHKVVIIDKCAHYNADRQRVTPFDITADLFDSLARLKTDYIDLYLLHRDDPSQPVGPIIEVLNEHVRAGRIHAFGASNWSHERIQAANKYANTHGLISFALSSVNFSLAVRMEEPWPGCISLTHPDQQAALDWYTETQMPLMPWSSLAGGFFSGRFTRDNLDSFTHELDLVCVNAYCYEENFKRLDRVRELASKKGWSIPQVAMAYVMGQSMNVFALVGCRNGAEFKENIEAYERRLSPKEIAWLELKTDDLAQ